MSPTKEKEKMAGKDALLLCEKELAQPRLRGTADPKKHPYAKAYKCLSEEDKQKVSELAASKLLEAFQSKERIDTLLYLICVGFTSDNGWNAVNRFLEAQLHLTGDVAFFREVAISLLEIADTELNDPTTKLPIAEAALVILTEFGLLLANQQGKSALDHKGASHVVEYISTSLLARSNVNSTAMRIALVHFLASCEPDRKSTQQLNRVISRFGHSLLEEMLKAFFDDKRKLTAAFFFLVEHLSSFFAASPKLAEMSHEVLKHYMLKYPSEFPTFLASYSEGVPKDVHTLTLATKHFALLQRAAIDVYQRQLAESIGQVMIRHLSLFRDISDEILHEQLGIVMSVFRSEPAIRGPRAIIIQDFLAEAQSLIGDSRAAQKIVSLTRAKRSKDNVVKPARVGEKPSPLASMISLAS